MTLRRKRFFQRKTWHSRRTVALSIYTFCPVHPPIDIAWKLTALKQCPNGAIGKAHHSVSVRTSSIPTTPNFFFNFLVIVPQPLQKGNIIWNTRPQAKPQKVSVLKGNSNVTTYYYSIEGCTYASVNKSIPTPHHPSLNQHWQDRLAGKKGQRPCF